MKIAVINGSPKGKTSVTMQYIKFIATRFPGHEFEYINAAAEVSVIKKNNRYFEGIAQNLRDADGIIWAFPVYFCLVPSQLKEFIEYIFEKDADLLKGKYSTAFTTSIHYFDHLAHNYIHSVSEDLGMHYVQGFSSEMEDMAEEASRKNILNFAAEFFDYIENGTPVEVRYLPVFNNYGDYEPGQVEEPVKSGLLKAVIVTDSMGDDTSLERMINAFTTLMPVHTEIIRITDDMLHGGCFGRLKCTLDGVCENDPDQKYSGVYREKILGSDIIVFAGAVRDRFLSYRWKMFLDQSFFNGHRPVLTGKQIAFIISGPLRQITNISEIIEAYVGSEDANLTGIVTDEYDDSNYVTGLLKSLAHKLVGAAEIKARRPATFPGYAGKKVLRDFVYGSKAIYKEDYAYYRNNDLFDFPQKNIKRRLHNAYMSFMLNFSRFRKEVYNNMAFNMIKPYEKFLKPEEKEEENVRQ